jgi:N-acetylglutamate synthase-like GNAT family acetyltransferase
MINPTGLDWNRFLVAVSLEDELAGCGQIKPHGEGIRELASIVVGSKYRGKGVARLIISQLIASNPKPIYLMCRSKLGPFYEKFGFQSISYNDMPPYFRRIARFVKVFSALARDDESLLVMKLE